uniref:Anticodon-binding domain-containing protein n=1 Tax=Spongospora subterranea TaxID=70186 RepID=A0A0H5RL13_9EUKA|eukprot:CRZ09414.1 hypothetical protein [Spongospora subterranea]
MVTEDDIVTQAPIVEELPSTSADTQKVDNASPGTRPESTVGVDEEGEPNIPVYIDNLDMESANRHDSDYTPADVAAMASLIDSMLEDNNATCDVEAELATEVVETASVGGNDAEDWRPVAELNSTTESLSRTYPDVEQNTDEVAGSDASGNQEAIEGIILQSSVVASSHIGVDGDISTPDVSCSLPSEDRACAISNDVNPQSSSEVPVETVRSSSEANTAQEIKTEPRFSGVYDPDQDAVDMDVEADTTTASNGATSVTSPTLPGSYYSSDGLGMASHPDGGSLASLEATPVQYSAHGPARAQVAPSPVTSGPSAKPKTSERPTQARPGDKRKNASNSKGAPAKKRLSDPPRPGNGPPPRKRSSPRARSPFRRIRRSPFRGPRSPPRAMSRHSPPRRRSPLRYRSPSPVGARRHDRDMETPEPTTQIICLGTAQSRYAAYCMDMIRSVGISCMMRYLDQQSLSTVMGAVVHGRSRYVIIIGKENELKGTVNFKVLTDKERKSVAVTIDEAVDIMIDRERPRPSYEPRGPSSEYRPRAPPRYLDEPSDYPPVSRYPDRVDDRVYERDPYLYSSPAGAPAYSAYDPRPREYSPSTSDPYARYPPSAPAPGPYSPPGDAPIHPHGMARYQSASTPSVSDGFSRYSQAYGGIDPRSPASTYDPYAAGSRVPQRSASSGSSPYPAPRSQYSGPPSYDYQY